MQFIIGNNFINALCISKLIGTAVSSLVAP